MYAGILITKLLLLLMMMMMTVLLDSQDRFSLTDGLPQSSWNSQSNIWLHVGKQAY